MIERPEWEVHMHQVVSEVIVERHNQIAKGFHAAHDDEHTDGSIALAAAAYAMHAGRKCPALLSGIPIWPWREGGPSDDFGNRKSLIYAAALCVAEIERIDRLSQLDANVVGGCSTITGARLDD